MTGMRIFGSTAYRLSTREDPKSRLPAFNASPAFRLTQAQNMSWEIGQGLATEAAGTEEWNEQEKEGWKTWMLDEMQPRSVSYRNCNLVKFGDELL